MTAETLLQYKNTGYSVVGGGMAKIRYIAEMNRYYVLFVDGSRAWCSQRSMEDLFPDRDWDIVKEKTNQWFYV